MESTDQKEIIANKDLVAFCGLYCGACKSYLKGKCPGCRENTKATWCKIRQCNIENKFNSCADCKSVELMECKKFNNFISKIFAVVFNSNREACINRIKEVGYEAYATEMANTKQQSLKRK